MLLGRASERDALAELLEEARGGQSRVLVLCGDPGVGKTALLEDAVQAASGSAVLPTPGSPHNTSTRLCPPRTTSNNSSSAPRSLARPSSIDARPSFGDWPRAS